MENWSRRASHKAQAIEDYMYMMYIYRKPTGTIINNTRKILITLNGRYSSLKIWKLGGARPPNAWCIFRLSGCRLWKLWYANCPWYFFIGGRGKFAGTCSRPISQYSTGVHGITGVCVLCSRQPINSLVNLIVSKRYRGVGKHCKLTQQGLGLSAAQEGIDFDAF